MIISRPARHGFVWLVPGQCASAHLVSAARGVDEAAAQAQLADWCARAYPLIMARQDATTAPACLRLGLALPPSKGRHRLAFDVPLAAIQRHAPPPRLSRIARMLPTHWQATLSALNTAACPAARQARVYGSAALHAITVQPCLAPHSDIDLLMQPDDAGQLDALLELLSELDAVASPRMDGEIVDTLGRAANWRELASGMPRLVVKSIDRVALIDRQDFIAALERDHSAQAELACS